jgi:hypothetical protein
MQFYQRWLYCVCLAQPHSTWPPLNPTRSFFALGGTLASGRNEPRDPPNSLKRQETLLWLCRRWLVLHAGKLLLVAAFCAAMQLPSAVGLLLVAAVAILAPTRQSPALPARPAASGAAPVVLLQLLSAGWLLACYVIQVPAIRDAVLDHGGDLIPWVLAWAGVPVVGDRPGAGELPLPGGGRGLEALLRWKALLLAAAALWQRARRWEGRLPRAVAAAARPGDACPLFWPPPGAMRPHAAPHGGAAGPWAAGAERMAAQLKPTVLKVGGCAG